MSDVGKKERKDSDLESLGMLRLDRFNSASSSSTRASITDIEEVPIRVIDWCDFNYPPFLNIIHFDLGDVPQGEVRESARLCHVTLKATFALFALNIVDTIVVVAFFEHAEKVRLLYAILNAVIFGSLAFYGFYQGIRGLAEATTDNLDAFRFAQTLMTIIMICFATVPCGSIEGFMSDAMLDRQTSGFWFVSAIIESIGWSLNAILSFYITSKAVFAAARSQLDDPTRDLPEVTRSNLGDLFLCEQCLPRCI
ncbi:hypothetical protein FOL47_006141 [Perkinsus chesapeaki]|uniref:Uncharacterized protein n=1 Tax=Perkinsus chesapeaki TaxID=330153 RepID=A0A7J6LTS3_PERCH|nr:hypothetical protein FOL47_006141 [Perkinsus chesapeaki]